MLILPGDRLLKKIKDYILSEEQLIENGFPRPDPDKAGNAFVQWTFYDKLPQDKGMFISIIELLLEVVVIAVAAMVMTVAAIDGVF